MNHRFIWELENAFFILEKNTWHGNPTIIKVLGGNRIISFRRKKVNFQRPILIILPIVRNEYGFYPPEVTIKIRGMLEDIIFSKKRAYKFLQF